MLIAAGAQLRNGIKSLASIQFSTSIPQKRYFTSHITMATHANLTLSSGITISTPTGILINNEWSTSSDGAKFLIHNPATGEELLEISHATPADVDRAVASARSAFNTTWGRNSVPSERAKCLLISSLFIQFGPA
jgi:hypothetical protein